MWVALKGPADFRIFQYYWNKQRLHVVRRPNTTRSNPHIWETEREFLACLQFGEIELGKKNPTSLNLTPPAWNDFLFSGKIQCFKALCHFLDAGDVVFSASDLYMKCFYLSKSKNNEIIQTNKKKKAKWCEAEFEMVHHWFIPNWVWQRAPAFPTFIIFKKSFIMKLYSVYIGLWMTQKLCHGSIFWKCILELIWPEKL